jgi:two-component SAPR family response regulator
VFEAADADEAISILRCTANIDLVATDMDMRAPDDGVSIANFVQDQRAGIPVVLASAHRPVDATLFAAVFIKPYAPEGLVNWIVARLRRSPIRVSDSRNARIS